MNKLVSVSKPQRPSDQGEYSFLLEQYLEHFIKKQNTFLEGPELVRAIFKANKDVPDLAVLVARLLSEREIDFRVKELAAKTIFGLSCDSGNLARLTDKEVCVHTRFAEVLLDPDSPADAREFAAGALFNLSTDEANCQKLLDACVHRHLVALLSLDAATDNAREFAARTLCNLSCNEANVQCLLAAGVHTQLVALLRGNATEKAKEFAAGALMNISFNEANAQCLLDAGVHTQLNVLLSEGAAASVSKKWAAFVLSHLATTRDSREFFREVAMKWATRGDKRQRDSGC